MSTKYELATELRALNRGMKALPICRMKKHELEAEIDRIKALNAMKDAMSDVVYTPAKPGPLGPRSLKTNKVTAGNVSLTVPEVPKTRIVKAGLIKQHGPRTLSFGDEDGSSDVIKHVEAVTAQKPHRCNCSKCPERAANTPA